MTVFVLFHSRVADASSGTEHVKVLGVFSTRQKAKAAQDEALAKPGFEAFPNGFSIDEYTVDAVEWSEGFEWVDE